MVLMYLHGFRSTPMSKKGQIMREAFSGRVQYLAPDLNTSPSYVQTIIQEAIKGIAPEELCLVGSSLGGFYATWLAEKVGCRAILLNPATEPWSVINDYLGLQPIGNTNRFIEVKPEFADEVRQMNCERIHPERYLVFCQHTMRFWTGIKQRANMQLVAKFFCRAILMKSIILSNVCLK